MLNQPMSSPMMNTMFGFFAAEAGSALGADVVVTAPAWARSRPFPTPSVQQLVSAPPAATVPTLATGCRDADGDSPACKDGLMFLVAATKPSNAPSPANASD